MIDNDFQKKWNEYNIIMKYILCNRMWKYMYVSMVIPDQLYILSKQILESTVSAIKQEPIFQLNT